MTSQTDSVLGFGVYALPASRRLRRDSTTHLGKPDTWAEVKDEGF